MPAPFVLKVGGRKGREMEESDVRGEAGVEQGRHLPDVVPGAGRGEVKDVPAKRKADDEWLAFAAEDPAFFIKTSDTV